MSEASNKEKVFDAAIVLVEKLTGLKAPEIEVAPPEIFTEFREHVETIHAIYTEPNNITIPIAEYEAMKLEVERYKWLRDMAVEYNKHIMEAIKEGN